MEKKNSCGWCLTRRMHSSKEWERAVYLLLVVASWLGMKSKGQIFELRMLFFEFEFAIVTFDICCTHLGSEPLSTCSQKFVAFQIKMWFICSFWSALLTCYHWMQWHSMHVFLLSPSTAPSQACWLQIFAATFDCIITMGQRMPWDTVRLPPELDNANTVYGLVRSNVSRLSFGLSAKVLWVQL